MVNGCLAYGVGIDDKDLDKIVEIVERDFGNESPKIRQGIEAARSGDGHISEVFDELNTIIEDVFLFQNGACCQIDARHPYFLGWKSRGSSDCELASFPIAFPTPDYLKRINLQLKKLVVHYKAAAFYIMADDCSFCT